MTTVDQTAISVSITKDLLARIVDRANALGLARSRYLAVIAQIDIAKGGPLTIPAQGTILPALGWAELLCAGWAERPITDHCLPSSRPFRTPNCPRA